jgi:hypothetical protein
MDRSVGADQEKPLSCAHGNEPALRKKAMKTSAMCFLSVSMLVAGSIALSGCGRIGICKGYETPDGPITAGTNRGFAVFKIESVDNTKYDDDFVLALARLFVNQFMPDEAAIAHGDDHAR